MGSGGVRCRKYSFSDCDLSHYLQNYQIILPCVYVSSVLLITSCIQGVLHLNEEFNLSLSKFDLLLHFLNSSFLIQNIYIYFYRFNISVTFSLHPLI